MGNVVGEGFKNYVSNQIKTRQEKLGSTVKDDSLLRYMNSNTGWIKATSTATGLAGTLPEQYVLFGGSFYGLTNTRDNTFSSYYTGWPEQGPKPQPGIVSMETKNRNRGSVRETTLVLKAFDKAQFEYIDLLYMRLGYSVLIEFGHTLYYDNIGNLQEASHANTLSYDLLTGVYDNNQEKLQKDIQQRKEASCGNYDAVFGRITNFNWTYGTSGTYDITVTLISYGDVVESLKINIGTDINTTTSAEESADENDSETIVANKNNNIFANLFYNLKEDLDNAGPVIQGPVSYLLNTKSFPVGDGTGPYYTYDAIRLDEKNWGDDTEYYYIRLGALLQYIWDKRMIYYKDGTSAVKVDTNVESNLMYLTPYTVSTDLKTCVIKTDIEIGGKTYKLFKDLPSDCNIAAEYLNTGRVMNVYVNMAYILRKIEELKDDKNRVVLIDLLNEICSSINSSLGGVNQLAPVIDEEEGRLYIIEEATIPNIDFILSKLGKTVKSELLRIYGTDVGKYGTFVTDFGVKTEISTELAATLTIGAQANGTAPGEDATAFSTWNAGLVDRVLPEKKVDKTDITGSNDINKHIQTLQKYVDYVANVEISDWDSVEEGMSSTLTNMLDLWRSKLAVDSGSASNALGFIPVNLNLTLKGLSGMKIYNKLEVASDFLPRSYGDKLTFLIKGITHKVDSNRWTTEVESISVPKNVVSGGNTITTAVTPTLKTTPQPSGSATTSPQSTISPTYISDPNPKFRAKSIFNAPGAAGRTKGLWSDLGGPSAHLNSAIRRGLSRIWQNTNAWDLDIPAGAYIYAMDKMSVGAVGSYGPYDPNSTSPHLYGDYFTATLSDGTQAYFAHLGSLNNKVVVGGTLELGEFIGTVAPASGWDPHLHLALSTGDLNQKYLQNDESNTPISNPVGLPYDWKRIGTFRKAAVTSLDNYQSIIQDLASIAATVRNSLLVEATGSVNDSQEIPRMDAGTKKVYTELKNYVTPTSPSYKDETASRKWLEENVFDPSSPQDAQYLWVYVLKQITKSYTSPSTLLDSDREDSWESILENYAQKKAPKLTTTNFLTGTVAIFDVRNPTSPYILNL